MLDQRFCFVGVSHSGIGGRRLSLRLALVTMVALGALAFTQNSYANDTNVVTGNVTSVVTKVGRIWDTYTVTTTVTIHYAGLALPNAAVYYDLYLWEEDVVFDNRVGGPIVTADL